MALWLFRRRSRRKRGRSGTQSDGEGGPTAAEEKQQPSRRQTEPQAGYTQPPDEPTPQQQLKKQRTEPNKLHRRDRAYSFEAGQQDNLRVGRNRSARRRTSATRRPSATNRPPLPPGANTTSTRDISTSSALGDDVFGRIPTLHNKRDGEHLPRKKSSKRRKADHDREAEIKAMSNFMPVRPATDAWQSGRPMKKDTRRVKTGLSLGFGNSGKENWDRDSPSSDISLPIPESIHSSLSTDSEQVSYKISAFDALAPRPTLRYTVYPRYGPPVASVPDRMPSQRRKLSEREPFPEATLRAHKRIDDLADDLSASDLRELMERDQRRKERKQQKEQEKVERRLARRAEKQRAAEREGRESPPNLERGVLGREAVGLGIEPPSAIVTSSSRRLSDPSPKQLGKQPEETEEEDENEKVDETRPDPLGTFHRTTSIPAESPAAPERHIAPEPPIEEEPKTAALLQSKKTRSKSPLFERQRTDISDSLRKGSESSSAKGGVSWASFFRWGNKNKRSSGPSSFSNTSRDSMAMNQPPPGPPVTYVPPRKLSSSVPKRTMSRFREDLPELPVSPPDSRIQSPEGDSMPLPIIEQESPEVNSAADPAPLADAQRYDTPAEGETLRDTPVSWNQNSDIADPSPEPQSMSLASIDSEASWLSGRFTARRQSSNIPTSQPQSRQNHYHDQSVSNGSDDTHNDPDLPVQERESPEDDGANIAEDEYLSRFANHRSSGSQWTQRKSEEARPSSDEEDDAHWGSVSGRQPTVIQPHMRDRLKSREGLLNSYEEDDSESDGLIDDEKGASPGEEKEAALQRATSVNMGHVRHISAGSAKLLEITPRTSVDAKRRSFEPKTST